MRWSLPAPLSRCSNPEADRARSPPWVERLSIVARDFQYKSNENQNQASEEDVSKNPLNQPEQKPRKKEQYA
jgi:hypothetical protein